MNCLGWELGHVSQMSVISLNWHPHCLILPILLRSIERKTQIGGNVIKTDKCMGASHFVWEEGAPGWPKVYAYVNPGSPTVNRHSLNKLSCVSRHTLHTR